MGGRGSGRRRKPLELHRLEGTYRRDRHGELPPPNPMVYDEPEPADEWEEELDGETRTSLDWSTYWTLRLAERAVSVTEIAAAAGLSRSTVSRLVNGSRQGWPKTKRALVAALREYEVLFQVEMPEEDEDDG